MDASTRNVCIVIPAYNPSQKILALIDSFSQKVGLHVLVVNDGSHAAHDYIFNALEEKKVTVLKHPINRGKGAALKTAFQHLLSDQTDGYLGVVTADADLQHLSNDILMIVACLEKNPHALHLGVRQFDHDVPFRSRFGNQLTQFLYRLFFNQHIIDTQTGLRAIPLHLMTSLCAIRGNAYEFELEMLIQAKRKKIVCEQHVITTVYIEGNRSSHFRPIRDSLKIYGILFRYAASGFLRKK